MVDLIFSGLRENREAKRGPPLLEEHLWGDEAVGVALLSLCGLSGSRGDGWMDGEVAASWDRPWLLHGHLRLENHSPTPAPLALGFNNWRWHLWAMVQGEPHLSRMETLWAILSCPFVFQMVFTVPILFSSRWQCVQPQERNHDSCLKTVMNSVCQELVYRWVSNPVMASTEETFPLIINSRWQRRASVLAARLGKGKGFGAGFTISRASERTSQHPELSRVKGWKELGSLKAWRTSKPTWGPLASIFLVLWEKSLFTHSFNQQQLRFCSGSGPGNRSKQAKELVFLGLYFCGIYLNR